MNNDYQFVINGVDVDDMSELKKVIRGELDKHDKELAKEYGVAGLGPCPMLKAGQVFYADYAKPQGLCDEAWKAIYQYVFALAHGGEQLFYYGDWIREKGVAICSCNDGIRPVIFKLECTDIQAKAGE